MTEQIKNYLKDRTQDAVLFFANETLTTAADPYAKQEAIEDVADLLAKIEKDILRESYLDQVSRQHKWVKKTDLKKLIGQQQEKVHAQEAKVEEKAFKMDLPETDRNDVMRYGFYAKKSGEKTGYYFRSGDEGQFKAVSNFIITPLFHKYGEDNTRIIEINNGQSEPVVVELPSKALISVDQFRSFLFDEGPFFFDGSKTHLDKLNKRYLFEFPKAFELNTLGQQPEGFFAFYNKAFNGKLTEYNRAGLISHNEQNFFSPASSDIYKNYRQNDDNDPYENDKYLKYQEASINFSQWAQLMKEAYVDHAMAGVAWVLVCLFRDIVFKVDNNAPFLYSYGPSQSGKSKFHESIKNLFFNQMPAFNLNSGTDFAFFQRMSRFRNCPIEFNEFNDDVVKDEWFEAIKGAFDGEGRERGRGMSKRKTETQKVNGLIMLAGQYLSTKDDNSVLSRSILRTFRKHDRRPAEQTAAYDKLKELEREGLSSIITELLLYRTKVAEDYPLAFNENLKELARSIRKGGDSFNERVLRNYTSLLTMYQLFEELSLPWPQAEFKAWIQNQVIEISDMIAQTDVLIDFWNSLEVMYENGQLKEGAHFKIEKEQRVKYHHKGKEERWKEYSEPRNILYLRLSVVQQEYAKWKRSIGQSALDLSGLTSYLKQRDTYYIGYNDGTTFYRFKKTEAGDMRRQNFPTSAHVFDYSQLRINLLRHDDDITDNSPEGKAKREEALQQEQARMDLDAQNNNSSKTDDDDQPF